MREFKIDIIGSSWEVRLREEHEDERLKDCSGFTDWTSRTIVMLDVRKSSNLGRQDVYMRKVLRHEIVHAFMFESGLGDDWTHEQYGQEETVVDWIAYQLPKLSATAEKAEKRLEAMLSD